MHFKRYCYAKICSISFFTNYITLLYRIGQAIDTCSERLDEECMAYDKAISLEEERTDMLTKALSSTNDDTGLDLMNTKDNDDDDKEDAILR